MRSHVNECSFSYIDALIKLKYEVMLSKNKRFGLETVNKCSQLLIMIKQMNHCNQLPFSRAITLLMVNLTAKSNKIHENISYTEIGFQFCIHVAVVEVYDLI